MVTAVVVELISFPSPSVLEYSIVGCRYCLHSSPSTSDTRQNRPSVHRRSIPLVVVGIESIPIRVDYSRIRQVLLITADSPKARNLASALSDMIQLWEALPCPFGKGKACGMSMQLIRQPMIVGKQANSTRYGLLI